MLFNKLYDFQYPQKETITAFKSMCGGKNSLLILYFTFRPFIWRHWKATVSIIAIIIFELFPFSNKKELLTWVRRGTRSLSVNAETSVMCNIDTGCRECVLNVVYIEGSHYLKKLLPVLFPHNASTLKITNIKATAQTWCILPPFRIPANRKLFTDTFNGMCCVTFLQGGYFMQDNVFRKKRVRSIDD